MKDEIKNPAAVKATKVAAKQPLTYSLANGEHTLALANDLKHFIDHNRLSSDVQGKQFVNVEGWQYAGSRLGIVPIIEEVQCVSTGDEIKYTAKVSLFELKTGYTVGAGFAICTNKESGKKFYQEFAIMSMAQTRAVGKAFRNTVAWLIRAAGYEPTPAEEMDYAGNSSSPKKAAEAGTSAQLPPAEMAAPAQPAAMVPLQRKGFTTEAQAFKERDEREAADKTPYMSQLQRELITIMLNNVATPRAVKSKVLLGINRLRVPAADRCISNLIKGLNELRADLPPDLEARLQAIAAEPGGKSLSMVSREAAEAELRAFIDANEPALLLPEIKLLYGMCDNHNFSAEDLLGAKQAAAENLAAEMAA